MKLKLIKLKVKSYIVSKIKQVFEINGGGYTWVGSKEKLLKNE